MPAEGIVRAICSVAACGRTVKGKGYCCTVHAEPRVARCAVCSEPTDGDGYFCSLACDAAERASRVVHKLVDGLRRLAP